MYIPEPYFKDIPRIGDLSLDYIFFEAGYPVLFTCVNDTDIYLCLCRTVVDEQKWIITEIDLETLEDLINNKVTIYNALKKQNSRACIAAWKKENPNYTSYRVINTELIDDAYLPDTDLLLDDEGESCEYLEQVKNRKQVKHYHELDSLFDDGNPDNICGISIEYENIKKTNIFLSDFAKIKFISNRNSISTKFIYEQQILKRNKNIFKKTCSDTSLLAS